MFGTFCIICTATGYPCYWFKFCFMLSMFFRLSFFWWFNILGRKIWLEIVSKRSSSGHQLCQKHCLCVQELVLGCFLCAQRWKWGKSTPLGGIFSTQSQIPQMINRMGWVMHHFEALTVLIWTSLNKEGSPENLILLVFDFSFSASLPIKSLDWWNFFYSVFYCGWICLFY